MAKEKSAWDRMRDREDEDLKGEEMGSKTAQELKKENKKIAGFDTGKKVDEKPQGGTEKLVQLMELVEPMIEQLNNLYNMFFAGAEKRPPLERRKTLDQMMQTIQNMFKSTQALQFRANSLNDHYNTFKDRWDKKMKDVENGKVQRYVKPH